MFTKPFRRVFPAVIAVLLLTMQSQAQTEETVAGLELSRDPRLDVLVKKQSQINKTAQFKNSSGQYKGYRLMVLNTNNRELAYQTRGQLLSRFPEHAVYMAYQAPYFKLKMGDFLKRADAEAVKKQLSGMFKQGVFVVADIISLKPEDEQRLLAELEKN